MKIIRCEMCGCEKETNKPNVRFCSDRCRSKWRRINNECVCKFCGKKFKGDRIRYCSDKCRKEVSLTMKKERFEKEEREKRMKQLTKLRNTLVNISNKTKVCNHCGEEFVKKNGIKYCSDECKEIGYRKLRRKYKRKHRVNRDKRWSKNGKIDYSITLEKLHSRDDGFCHLCNRKTNFNDYKITTEGHFIAGDNYPSIDHVVPIANGGLHRWDNVKLAHRKCNYIKADNEIEFQLFLNV